MNFEKAYAQFMEKHIDEANGLRKERLLKGHGFGEKLFLKDGWWEAFGNFDYLYPEFMVRDFVNGFRFLDFAYWRPPHILDFEVDGFGVHNMDRRQFSDDRDRQNYLVMDGWKVFRFSVDKLKERPRECQKQLQQIIGIYYGDIRVDRMLSQQEHALIHYAGRYGADFTPRHAAEWLGISQKQARMYLHRLMDKGHIEAVSGEERIRTYKISFMKKMS